MRIIVFLVLLLPAVAFADIRLVYRTNDGRIIKVLGPNDPDEQNTVSVPDGSINPKEIDKYEFSGGAVRKRAVSQLKDEFLSERVADLLTRIDSVSNLAEAKALLKDIVNGIVWLEKQRADGKLR